jgi:hypothetical protein
MFGGAEYLAQGGATDVDASFPTLELKAGPNTWNPTLNLSPRDGNGITDYHDTTNWPAFDNDEQCLGDRIFQMTMAAADTVWDTPVGKVDINDSDEILPSQHATVRALASRYSDLFEDNGTVAKENEDEYMKIVLKPGVELPSKGPYNNSAKDRKVIDETFDGYHLQDKMGWAKQAVKAAFPAFVVWQKDKGRVVMDIRGLNSRV